MQLGRHKGKRRSERATEGGRARRQAAVVVQGESGSKSSVVACPLAQKLQPCRDGAPRRLDCLRLFTPASCT